MKTQNMYTPMTILVIILSVVSSSVGFYALSKLPDMPRFKGVRTLLLSAAILAAVSAVLISFFLMVVKSGAGTGLLAAAGLGVMIAGLSLLSSTVIYAIAAVQLGSSRISAIVGSATSLIATASYIFVAYIAIKNRPTI